MNLVGIVLLIILGFGLIKGFMDGFVKQLASIAGFVLGIIAAYLFAGIITEKLALVVDAPISLLLPLSYFIIFLAVAIACSFLGRFLNSMVNMASLGGLNRLGGAVAGFLKYAVILGLIINLYNSLDDNGKIVSQETRQKATLYYPLQQLGGKMLPYINEIQGNKLKLDKYKKEEDKTPTVEI